MKGCVLWALLLFSVAGMALMLLSYCKAGTTSLFPGFTSAHCSDDATVNFPKRDDETVKSSRKLKEITRPSTSMKRGGRSVDLDDYLPIDPAPSSKASIQPGPIEHGTPLMPFIPKSPPPDPPKSAPLP